MPVNANWARWIYASIAKHVLAEVASPLVFDFGGKRTSAWETAVNRAEVTISGPKTRKLGRNAWKVEIDVFVIVSSDLSANNYDHVDVTGDVANALDTCIEVKDFGATGLLQIGTLQPRKGLAERIDVTHLKPANADDRIHSTINARFEGTFLG